jgi:hypothetical protein
VAEAQAFGDGECIVVVVFDLAEGHALFELGDQFGIEADPGGLKRCQGRALLQVDIEREPEQARGFQPEFEMRVAVLGQQLDEMGNGLVGARSIVLDREPVSYFLSVRFVRGAEKHFVLVDVPTDTENGGHSKPPVE